MLKTKEQRRRDIKRFLLLKKKEKEKGIKGDEKQQKIYPPLINGFIKNTKKVDISSGVASLDYLNSVFICYYKLRQFGFDDIKIVVTQSHAWTEFKYNDEWWILDLTSLKKLSLGEPIKRKKYTLIEPYTDFARTFTDIKEFNEIYHNKLHYSFDEAKIAATKDIGLNRIFRK